MNTPKILLIASFSLGARSETPRPPSWCKSQFKWNYDQKGVKLLDDCDILKDQFILNVGTISNKTMCINRIQLNIGGTQMKTWSGIATGELTFENKLAVHVRKSQLLVTLIARNNQKHQAQFKSQFSLDSRNCSEEELTDGENEANVTSSDYDTENTEPGALVIAISSTASATLLLVAIIILTIVCMKKRWFMNDTYGTYERGWYGEGEYGEGDKVYVTDTNDYYSAS